MMPPIKLVNESTPDAARKSIHMLFTQGNSESIVRWLSNAPNPPSDDLLGYIWMQSIRSNLTQPIAAWMQARYPGKIQEFNATLDIVKMLHSPRTWNALKTESLVPALSYEDIAKVTAAWNKNAIAVAKNFRRNGTNPKMEAYFKECVAIQIDFLDHFVASYRTKSALLRVGLESGRYGTNIDSIPNYGSKDPLLTLLQERAQVMAASNNPDMWMLASLEERNTPLSYYLSHSPHISIWWQPLLAQVYVAEFPKENWQRYLSKTSPEERPVPDTIMMAYHLTAGTTNIKEQISIFMEMGDTAQDRDFEELDLAAIAFDME